MINRFFDFEVFPHWWCCVFGDLPEEYSEQNIVPESIKDTFVVVTSEDEHARDSLLSMFAKDYCMVGYNVKHYDLVIANAIYQGFSPEQVKIVNDLIINPSLQYKDKEHMRLFSFSKKKYYPYSYQDLLDDGEGSLKEKECNLGLDIRETTVPFDQEVLNEEDLASIIYYCKHDVYSSMVFYLKVVEAYTTTKINLAKMYNIPEAEAHTYTNAALVAKVLKGRRKVFSDSNDLRLYLPEKIKSYCEENFPEKVLNYILNYTEPLQVRMFDNDVSFGNGGIHSVYCKNLYVESDDEYQLVNVDAASYYPSILIQFDSITRAVDNPQIFVDIYNERLRIKHLEHKTIQDDEANAALKLVLNTTFGASGNKYLDTYDPYQCTKCCRIGQIFLGSLACKMVKTIPGLKVMQTNTDGILAYVPRKYWDKLIELTDEWHTISGILLEFDMVDKIWQRDVNNYLLIKDGTKVKRKGAWLQDNWRKPGYVMMGPLIGFISRRAALNYLLYGTDIIETVAKCTCLEDFAITCKKGPTYSRVVQRFADGHEEELFKCNRVYASKDKSLGMLYKIKTVKGKLSYTKMANVPENCRTINAALDSYDFNEIKKDLDYLYYVSTAADLIDIDWTHIYHDKLLKDKDFRYKI